MSNTIPAGRAEFAGEQPGPGLRQESRREPGLGCGSVEMGVAVPVPRAVGKDFPRPGPRRLVAWVLGPAGCVTMELGVRMGSWVLASWLGGMC